LKQTHPHFVRCIIPNEIKTGGVLDSHLVMHQLTCNGVLEGIRICRKGFPNRIIYAEFKQRYSILAPNAIPKDFVDAKKATDNILKEIALSEDLYRLGTTKVFFKAGTLGHLEDLRDQALSRIIARLQAQVRGYCMKKDYKKMLEQRLALSVLQRNVRKYLSLRNWAWWKLYTKVKPLLSVARQEDELKKLEDEFKALKETLEKEEKLRKETEENNSKLIRGRLFSLGTRNIVVVCVVFLEKNDLYLQLESERSTMSTAEERLTRLGTNIESMLTFVVQLVAVRLLSYAKGRSRKSNQRHGKSFQRRRIGLTRIEQEEEETRTRHREHEERYRRHSFEPSKVRERM
jgi:myosin heavy subunit